MVEKKLKTEVKAKVSAKRVSVMAGMVLGASALIGAILTFVVTR